MAKAYTNTNENPVDVSDWLVEVSHTYFQRQKKLKMQRTTDLSHAY